MKERKLKQAYILNFIIFGLLCLAIFLMLIDFDFATFRPGVQRGAAFYFKYFTTLSNVFAGLVSLVLGVFQLLAYKDKIQEVSSYIKIIKLASTTGVTLTMLTTMLYLAPLSEMGYFYLFKNCNFFLHFFIPLLSIISFTVFESNAKIKFIHTVTAVLPVLIYGIFYMGNIIIHLDNGKVVAKYDLYAFLKGGFNTIYLVVPMLFLITWIFAALLWKLNLRNKD